MTSRPTIDLRRSVAFAADVVLRVIDDDALLLKLENEEVFALNATGARIAELIVEGRRLDAVVDLLSREYGADPADISRDVADLVAVLLSRGLLVPAAAGDDP